MNDFLYPFGTAELYPQMQDSDGNVLIDTAHEYRECSNNGYCDRSIGICNCFEGYEGTSCQRLSCPKLNGLVCNGHGQCELAKTLASSDSGNVYELWDMELSTSCVCDSGYYGASCENRRCKTGFDPVYSGLIPSVRFSNWSYVIHTKSSTAILEGNYSIVFYDHSGEDWKTQPIDIAAGCNGITAALESLPNSVIPSGSVLCLIWPQYNLVSANDEPVLFTPNPYYGIKVTLAFPQNPGKLKQPTLDFYLDGGRPTLNSNEYGAIPGVFVYSNGFNGEDVDYFSNPCIGVDVTIEEYVNSDGSHYHFLSGLTFIEERTLAKCLGDADGLLTDDASGRVEGSDFSWDYGSAINPHLIRLAVKSGPEYHTDLCPGSMNSIRGGSTSCSFPIGTILHPPGFIATLIFDPISGLYKLLTKPGLDYDTITEFSVYTTDGVAQMVSNDSRIVTDSIEPYSKVVYMVNSTDAFENYDGDVSCESNGPNVNGAFDCIEKNDLIFFLDPSLTSVSFAAASKYLNLYTVQKIYRDQQARSFESIGSSRGKIVLDKSINNDWSYSFDRARAYLYKPRSFYPYATECSNRGLCNTATGVCECFRGYEQDDCSRINNIIQ